MNQSVNKLMAHQTKEKNQNKENEILNTMDTLVNKLMNLYYVISMIFSILSANTDKSPITDRTGFLEVKSSLVENLLMFFQLNKSSHGLQLMIYMMFNCLLMLEQTLIQKITMELQLAIITECINTKFLLNVLVAVVMMIVINAVVDALVTAIKLQINELCLKRFT